MTLPMPPEVFRQFMRCETTENLSARLDEMIRREAYEYAAVVRDEIRRREERTHTHRHTETDGTT